MDSVSSLRTEGSRNRNMQLRQNKNPRLIGVSVVGFNILYLSWVSIKKMTVINKKKRPKTEKTHMCGLTGIRG